MRKVIFVGGTAYSGSSFFHMMLANDPKGFSCGEIAAFCHPSRSGHVAPKCGCGDDTCTIWQEIAASGTGSVFEALFYRFPEVEFIVSSSKNPFWIQSQCRALSKRGIQTERILIWKTPLEFASSCKRRGRPENWDAQWLHYHRLYASLMDEWRAVPYRAFVQEPSILQACCRYLGIPYFDGKERYWERVHHVLFSSYAAKMHLYSAGIAQAFVAGTAQREKMPLYRTIYYQGVEDDELLSAVTQTVEGSALYDRVINWLDAHDVVREQVDETTRSGVRFSMPELALRKGKYLARMQIAKLKYGQRAC